MFIYHLPNHHPLSTNTTMNTFTIIAAITTAMSNWQRVKSKRVVKLETRMKYCGGWVKVKRNDQKKKGERENNWKIKVFFFCFFFWSDESNKWRGGLVVLEAELKGYLRKKWRQYKIWGTDGEKKKQPLIDM